MSDTSELLTTYMNAGAVGEAPRHLRLVPPADTTNQSDVQLYLSPTQSIGSSALSEITPEFIEPDPEPVKGMRRPGTNTLGSAPEDEFGRKIYATADGDPDTIGRHMVQDRAETATSRHTMNEDRFVAATLMVGKVPSIDSELADFQEERMNRSVRIVPNPTEPPLFDKQVAKATAIRLLGQVKNTAARAIQRYRDKPLLKDKQ